MKSIKLFILFIAAIFFAMGCETSSQDASTEEQAAQETQSGDAKAADASKGGADQAVVDAPKEESTRNISQLQKIYFDFDKSEIKDTFKEALKTNADWIKANPDVKVVIEGHCDERGTNEYNLALGERRSKTVLDFLIALGVKPEQMSTVSYGEERPAAQGHNEAAWSQNRRAEFSMP